MKVDTKQRIGFGYYGHVFKLEGTNSVIKIFRKHDDIDECWIRKIYGFEKKARL